MNKTCRKCGKTFKMRMADPTHPIRLIIIWTAVLLTDVTATVFTVTLLKYQVTVDYAGPGNAIMSASKPFQQTENTITTSAEYVQVNSTCGSLRMYTKFSCRQDEIFCKINNWFTLTVSIALAVALVIKYYIIKWCITCCTGYYRQKRIRAEATISDYINQNLPNFRGITVHKTDEYRPLPTENDEPAAELNQDEPMLDTPPTYFVANNGQKYTPGGTPMRMPSLVKAMTLMTLLCLATPSAAQFNILYSNTAGLNEICFQPTANSIGTFVKVSTNYKFCPNVENHAECYDVICQDGFMDIGTEWQGRQGCNSLGDGLNYVLYQPLRHNGGQFESGLRWNNGTVTSCAKSNFNKPSDSITGWQYQSFVGPNAFTGSTYRTSTMDVGIYFLSTINVASAYGYVRVYNSDVYWSFEYVGYRIYNAAMQPAESLIRFFVMNPAYLAEHSMCGAFKDFDDARKVTVFSDGCAPIARSGTTVKPTTMLTEPGNCIQEGTNIFFKYPSELWWSNSQWSNFLTCQNTQVGSSILQCHTQGPDHCRCFAYQNTTMAPLTINARWNGYLCVRGNVGTTVNPPWKGGDCEVNIYNTVPDGGTSISVTIETSDRPCTVDFYAMLGVGGPAIPFQVTNTYACADSSNLGEYATYVTREYNNGHVCIYRSKSCCIGFQTPASGGIKTFYGSCCDTQNNNNPAPATVYTGPSTATTTTTTTTTTTPAPTTRDPNIPVASPATCLQMGANVLFRMPAIIFGMGMNKNWTSCVTDGSFRASLAPDGRCQIAKMISSNGVTNNERVLWNGYYCTVSSPGVAVPSQTTSFSGFSISRSYLSGSFPTSITAYSMPLSVDTFVYMGETARFMPMTITIMNGLCVLEGPWADYTYGPGMPSSNGTNKCTFNSFVSCFGVLNNTDSKVYTISAGTQACSATLNVNNPPNPIGTLPTDPITVATTPLPTTPLPTTPVPTTPVPTTPVPTTPVPTTPVPTTPVPTTPVPTTPVPTTPVPTTPVPTTPVPTTPVPTTPVPTTPVPTTPVPTTPLPTTHAPTTPVPTTIMSSTTVPQGTSSTTSGVSTTLVPTTPVSTTPVPTTPVPTTPVPTTPVPTTPVPTTPVPTTPVPTTPVPTTPVPTTPVPTTPVPTTPAPTTPAPTTPTPTPTTTTPTTTTSTNMPTTSPVVVLSSTKKPKPSCDVNQFSGVINVGLLSLLFGRKGFLLALCGDGIEASLLSSHARTLNLNRLAPTGYGEHLLNEDCSMPKEVVVSYFGNNRCVGFQYNQYTITDALCFQGNDPSPLKIDGKSVSGCYKTNGVVNVFISANSHSEQRLCSLPKSRKLDSVCLTAHGIGTKDCIQHANLTRLAASAFAGPFNTIAFDVPYSNPNYIMYNVQIVPITDSGEVIVPYMFSLVPVSSGIYSCVYAMPPLPYYATMYSTLFFGCNTDDSASCFFLSSCTIDPAGAFNLTVYNVTNAILPAADMYTDGTIWFQNAPNNPVECIDIASYLQQGVAPANTEANYFTYNSTIYGIASNYFITKNLLKIAGKLFAVNYLQATEPEFGNQFGYDGLPCVSPYETAYRLPATNTYNMTGTLVNCYAYDVSSTIITYLTYNIQWYVSTTYLGIPNMVTPIPSVYDVNAVYLKPTYELCQTSKKALVPIGTETGTTDRLYSASFQLPVLSCFVDEISVGFVGMSTFSADIFAEIYYESKGHVPGVSFANLPSSITEFGYNTNWTSWKGVCSSVNRKACYNNNVTYDSNDHAESGIAIDDRPILVPVPIGTNAEPQPLMTGISYSSSPCLGESANILYYNCQYLIGFWVVMAILMFLFVIGVAMTILTLVKRRNDRKYAFQLYAKRYKKCATAMYYGISGYTKRIRAEKDNLILDGFSTTLESYEKLIDTSPYQVINDSIVYPGRKSEERRSLLGAQTSSNLFDVIKVLAILIAVVASQQCLDMSAQTLYSTKPKLSEYLSATEQNYNPKQAYTDMEDIFKPSAFIPPVGTSSPTVSGSEYVCTENGDCTCRIDASIGVVRLIPGTLLTFKAKCQSQSTLVTMRIGSVRAQYRPEYLYSTTDLAWKTEQTYSCTGSCSARNCLNIKPGEGYPFYSNLKSELGRTVGVNCCYLVNVGYGLAGAQARPSGNVYVHVFKYVLTSYSANYCLQSYDGIRCYDSTQKGPVAMTISNVGLPSSFDAGIVYKSGAYLRTVLGAFLPQNAPSWRHFPDLQFNGLTSGGCPGKLVWSDADPVVWGTWKQKGCFVPSLSKHDKNWIDQITVPDSAALLILNEINYPRIQENSVGIRVRNQSISYTSGSPMSYIDVEAVTPTGSATALFSQTVNLGNVKQQFTDSIDSITLRSCRFTIGSNVNSNCTLAIVWKVSDLSFMVDLVTDDQFYSRVIDTMLLTPDVDVWYPRFNAYNTQTTVTLIVKIAGVTVATLKTTDVVYVKPGGVDQTEDIIDSNVPQTGGNTAMTWQNILIITAVCVVGAIVLVVAIVTTVYCAKRYCGMSKRVE
jgi:hypothetical protein